MAETDRRETKTPSQWFIAEIKRENYLPELHRLGDMLWAMKFSEDNALLVETWMERWAIPFQHGLTDPAEVKYYEDILAHLRAQEEASRARVAAVREDARKCMLEVERLLNLNNVGRGH